MILEIKTYNAECDMCGVLLQHRNYDELEVLIKVLNDTGWQQIKSIHLLNARESVVSDVPDKLYCPDCIKELSQ